MAEAGWLTVGRYSFCKEYFGMGSVSLQILAVDDEPLILMTLVDMLEDLGHDTKSAFTGKQALDQLKSQRFDVLLTDQSMPQMTGDQLIAQALEINPSIHVILATGYSEPPPGLRSNVVKLTKPFTEHSLVAALAQVMQCE